MDCFKGQPPVHGGTRYRLDPGVSSKQGAMSYMELREIERTKIKCASKLFDEMNRRYAPRNVKYDMADNFGRLMEIVK